MSWPRKHMFLYSLDGDVFLNANALDGVDIAELVDKPDVIVGVRLTAHEVRKLRRHLRDGSSEAAGFIAGGRRRRRTAR